MAETDTQIEMPKTNFTTGEDIYDRKTDTLFSKMNNYLIIC